MARCIRFTFSMVVLLNSLAQGQSSWEIEGDSMNLAIIVLDYQTFDLLGGHFSIHPACADCDKEDLPFAITYNSPGDFGDILIRYSATQDTLFFAEIIWMGLGSIHVPNMFVPADSLKQTQADILDPISTEYFEFSLAMPDSILRPKADSAWQSIKQLQIVNQFSDHAYRMGIYLYPPSVGVFNPQYAQWIIFLYQGRTNPSLLRDNLALEPGHFAVDSNYPNPFNGATHITYATQNPRSVKLRVFDILGREITTLSHYRKVNSFTLDFDRAHLPSGIYFYTLQAGNENTPLKKMLFIK